MRPSCSLGSAQTGAEQGESRTGLSGALPRSGEELQEGSPTCLLPTETRERVPLALSPCFLHLQLSLILPFGPPGLAPSVLYMSPIASTENRSYGSVVTCYGKVCTSLQATFLETHPYHTGRLLHQAQPLTVCTLCLAVFCHCPMPRDKQSWKPL